MKKTDPFAPSTPKKLSLGVWLIRSFMNGLSKIWPALAGRIAFILFCKPKKKAPKRAEETFLATGELQFETLNGRKYAVWHWGFKGPIVLLAHGWESHSGRWRKLAPRLVQAGYQVIAIDAPAHGRSNGWRFTLVEYAGILRHLLHKYGPVDTIIGHSVGGSSVVWALGTMSPTQRPKKAVILAAFSTLEYTMRKTQVSLGINDAIIEGVDQQIHAMSGLKLKNLDMAHKAADLGAVRTLLIHDEGDLVTSVEESARLHTYWPGSRLVRTTGFGHGLTAPEVIEMIADFVEAKEAVMKAD